MRLERPDWPSQRRKSSVSLSLLTLSPERLSWRNIKSLVNQVKESKYHKSTEKASVLQAKTMPAKGIDVDEVGQC